MKSNGLSSTARNIIRKKNRQVVMIDYQERMLAAKAQQLAIRQTAEKARLENAKREAAKAQREPSVE